MNSRTDQESKLAAPPGLDRVGLDLAPNRVRGLRLRHPVMVAAGGAGYGLELIEAVDALSPGAVVTRSVTVSPQSGDPPPRMTSTQGAVITSLGLQNHGIEEVLRRYAPRWATSEVPIILSICGDSASDISRLARSADAEPGVSGIELNLGCPDAGRRGLPIGLDVEASETATVSARALTDLPLVVKLTTSAPDIREIARAVAAAGADAISVIDRLPAVAIDRDHRAAALGSNYGGLSGPSLKPIGLRVVFEIAQVVRIPVIGIGGVSSLDDVLDYLAAGASAVGLTTAALADPALPGRLGDELQAWCDPQGIESYSELIGRALPSRRDRGSLRSGYRTR